VTDGGAKAFVLLATRAVRRLHEMEHELLASNSTVNSNEPLLIEYRQTSVRGHGNLCNRNAFIEYTCGELSWSALYPCLQSQSS